MDFSCFANYDWKESSTAIRHKSEDMASSDILFQTQLGLHGALEEVEDEWKSTLAEGFSAAPEWSPKVPTYPSSSFTAMNSKMQPSSQVL